jgi:hypothetical protein
VAVLILAPLVVGVLVGYATGGRLRGLTGTGIRATWVLWLAAGLQFVSFQWHVSLTVPVFALVGAWLMVNVPRRPRPVQVAAALILLGGALNAAVIAANGRMPYSQAAVVAIGAPADEQTRALRSAKYAVADERTRLAWLGDDLPVVPLGKIVSVGDLVLLLGVAGLVATSMRAAPVRRGQPSVVDNVAVNSRPKLSTPGE